MSIQSEMIQSAQKQPNKKNYRQPQLHIYGSIHEVTRAADNSGKDDNGMGKTDKT